MYQRALEGYEKVKDSRQYLERDDEDGLLREATRKGTVRITLRL
jgi:hypothetical protein